MNNIQNQYANRLIGGYSQQNTTNYTSKANQNQTFADIMAAIKQPQTTAQSQTTTAQTNPTEEQQRIIQALLNHSTPLSSDAKGSYPTEEQLDMLREKYKDADFSAYYLYDNVSRHDGGGLTWTTSTGFSEAHGNLLKDLRDMGIMSEQDMTFLSLEALHVNINDLGDMRNIHNNLPAFEEFRNDKDISENIVLSGRGNAFDIIEYYRGLAASMSADRHSSVAEANERVANILDAIINGAELPA